MNKYLKLSLVFATIIGVIVALSQIGTIFPGQAPNPNSDSRYDEISKEIGKCWNDKNQWNEDSYNYCMNKINDYYRKSYIKKKDYHLLFSRVNAEAVNTINAFYDAEMQKSGCNDSDIEKNKNGLDYISGYKNPYDDDYDFSKDERVIKAHYMYEQYKGIINFCERDFIVEAKIYNGCTWTPFSYYNDQWDSQKSSLEQGEYYRSHFSKIDKVKNAWASYDGKIYQSKNNYYTDIAVLIKVHFNERYTNKRFKTNQDKLIEDYNNLKSINEGLKNSYYKTKEEYNSIKTNYDNIKSNLDRYNESINNCRFGSNNYYKKVAERDEYIRKVTGENKYIKNKQRCSKDAKNSMVELKRNFEDNESNINKLIDVKNKHQNEIDTYRYQLKNVVDKYKKESPVDNLSSYHESKVNDITNLIINIPEISNVPNNYKPYLESWSNSIDEIINKLNELLYEE